MLMLVVNQVCVVGTLILVMHQLVDQPRTLPHLNATVAELDKPNKAEQDTPTTQQGTDKWKASAIHARRLNSAVYDFFANQPVQDKAREAFIHGNVGDC